MSTTDNDTNIVARSTLKRLRGSGVDIDSDAVIDNYVEVEFKDKLDTAKDATERKKIKDRCKKWYTEGDGKTFMDEQITKLKDVTSKVKSDLENLTTSAQSVVTSNTIPSVITTGSATSTPNPAWFTIENKQKKTSLLVICNSINNSLIELMSVAMLIHWVIPDEVLDLIQIYTTLYSIITAI